MLVWLMKEHEPLPIDGDTVRLFRMGILAEKIAECGHDVVWWCSTFNHAEKKYRYHHQYNIKVKPNYELRLIHANSYKKNMSIARIWHHYRTACIFEEEAQKVKKPDIIVVAMPTIDFTCKAVKFGIDHKIPVVVDIRDLWPDIYEDYFPAFAKPLIRMMSIWSKFELSWALRNATGIVGLTKPYLYWGLDYARRAPNKYDRVFPFGYKDAIKSSSQESVNYMRKIGLNDDDFIGCFFGQLGIAADIDTIVEAAKLCENDQKKIKIVICGTGEKLQSLIIKTAGMTNIFFPGWIDAEKINTIASRASFGIMPYKPSKNYEMNIPNKFSEYLSFGLPILVQPSGIMTEMVKNNCCGLHYSNSQELYECIVQLYKNKDLHQSMSVCARRLYENEFRADQIYTNMVEYLESIVNQNDLTKV